MAVNLKNIEMYSEKAGKVVSWDVSTVNDESTTVGYNEDGSPIRDKVVELTYDDEVQRYSPNITDEELQRVAKRVNEENNN